MAIVPQNACFNGQQGSAVGYARASLKTCIREILQKPNAVLPANAGIQLSAEFVGALYSWISFLRGNDGLLQGH